MALDLLDMNPRGGMLVSRCVVSSTFTGLSRRCDTRGKINLNERRGNAKMETERRLAVSFDSWRQWVRWSILGKGVQSLGAEYMLFAGCGRVLWRTA